MAKKPAWKLRLKYCWHCGSDRITYHRLCDKRTYHYVTCANCLHTTRLYADQRSAYEAFTSGNVITRQQIMKLEPEYDWPVRNF